MKKKFSLLVFILLSNMACEKSEPFKNINQPLIFENISKDEIVFSEIDLQAKLLGFKIKKDKSLNLHNSLLFSDKVKVKEFLKALKKDGINKAFSNYSPDNWKSSNGKQIKISDKFDISTYKENSVTTECYNSNRFFSRTATSTGLADLNIDFYTNATGIPYNISSGWIGFALGLGWQQNSYSGLNNTPFLTAGGFILRGTQQINIFWEGIGTIYSYPVAYRVQITCAGHVSVDEIYE